MLDTCASIFLFCPLLYAVEILYYTDFRASGCCALSISIRRAEIQGYPWLVKLSKERTLSLLYANFVLFSTGKQLSVLYQTRTGTSASKGLFCLLVPCPLAHPHLLFSCRFTSRTSLTCHILTVCYSLTYPLHI